MSDVQDARVREIRESGTDVERLWREDGARLWRSVALFAGDPDVASDAVAEAFAQALRRGDAIRSLQRWVWRAAFRIAAGELHRRRAEANAAASNDRGPAGPAFYELPEPTADLVVALRRLSAKQRAAVVLHHYAGYPLKEVARILDSTTSAVGVHLHRGRTRLRDLLGDDDA